MPIYYIKLWDMDDQEFMMPLPLKNSNGKTRKARKPMTLKVTWLKKIIRRMKDWGRKGLWV